MEEFEIVRKNGRNHVILACDYCGDPFTRRLDFVKRDGLEIKACSSGCANKIRSTSVAAVCVCGKSIKRKPSEMAKSQSGKYYCSKTCSNGTHNVARSGENHPLYKYGHTTYRQRALEHYGEACTVCGYAIVEVVEVHHRDGNREHNDMENLDVLCPTHHTEFERGVRVYEGLGSRLIGKTTASEAVNMGSMPVSPTIN